MEITHSVLPASCALKISLLWDLPGAEGRIPDLCSPGALWLLLRELGIPCSLSSEDSGHGCSCSSLGSDLLGKNLQFVLL